MPNQRMFIYHRPSNTAVYIGKRMAGGYYDCPGDLSLWMQQLFDWAEAKDLPSGERSNAMDNFEICYELINEGVPVLPDDAVILNDGIRRNRVKG